ncbi:MAG: NAD(P)H-dependent glycerol-3-phosphate dehydrogenase [Wolbachia endosymbiont of Menacanthus eurysternus]|nr:MAG: NAD(P)H-dependent glycerol-3-phosphate dehydrogenase [Wolbachia endosymbiont of Menacanthus eurysternus]
MNISILGAGAWGTAIAISLSNKQNIVLWTRNKTTFESINRIRESDKLLGYKIPDNVLVKLALEEAINTSAIILAIPTQSIREVCYKLRSCNLKKEIVIILACKGIEKFTLKLPSEIVNEILPNNQVAIFSGPSFAIEVAKKLPYSMLLACQDNMLGLRLISELQQKNVKLYLSIDIMMVQICAALKNVFAIACGIILSKKLGCSAHAALIANGMNEIKALYLAKTGNFNINTDTLLGPACLGDLVMTCTSLNSRNLSFGFKIGDNNSNIEQILSKSRSVTEGFTTTQSIFALAKELNIKMPICEAMYKLLYKRASIDDTISSLIN